MQIFTPIYLSPGKCTSQVRNFDLLVTPSFLFRVAKMLSLKLKNAALPLRINKFCCVLFSSSWSCMLQAVINKDHLASPSLRQLHGRRHICCSHSTSYSSRIAIFPIQLHSTPPLRGSPWEYRHKV